MPLLAGGCEGVERVAVGEIADRVDGDRQARTCGAADDVLELLTARDLDPGSIEQARRTRAERAVHESLDVADSQQVVAEAGADTHLRERVDMLMGKGLPDAERERAFVP